MHRCTPNGPGCTPTVPRPRAQRVLGAVSWRPQCRIAGAVVGRVAGQAPYRGPVSRACTAVSWPISRHNALSHAPSGHDTHFVSRPSPCRMPYRSPHSSVTIQHCVLRHNPPAGHSTLLSRYKRLYRDTPQPINHRLSRYNRLYSDMLPNQLHTQHAMSRYNFHCIVTQFGQ